MNWKRISIYTLILFLALVLSGIITGVEEQSVLHVSHGIVISFFIELIAFIFLAKKQCVKPFVQAIAVVILLNIFSLPIGYFLPIESSLLIFAVDSTLLLIAAMLGTAIGVRFQSKQMDSIEMHN